VQRLHDGVGDSGSEGIALAAQREERGNVGGIFEPADGADRVTPHREVARPGQGPERVSAEPRLLGIEHDGRLADEVHLLLHGPGSNRRPHLHLLKQRESDSCRGDSLHRAIAGDSLDRRSCRSI
jgi:hypothetical protein